MDQAFDIVVLAAGNGRRMGSSTPKVLHEIAGVPMLTHVLRTARQLAPRQIYLVVSPDHVAAIGAVAGDDCELVIQNQPQGTGHALSVALAAMTKQSSGADPIDEGVELMVMCGDTPLLQAPDLALMRTLLKEGSTEPEQQAALVVLTAELVDPNGYGRIIRDTTGRLIEQIIEEPEDNVGSQEINAGAYVSTTTHFARWLEKIRPNAHSQERHLTDIVKHASAEPAHSVLPMKLSQPMRALGVNTKSHLAIAEALFQKNLINRLLCDGVTLADPHRLTIRGDVCFGQDCFVDVGAVLTGPLSFGDGVHVGAYSVISRSQIADNVHIQPFTHIDQSTIGKGASIGPFARIRDHSVLQQSVTIGNFVETKDAHLGVGTTAKHLAYLGNVEAGQDINVGAGTITCNYDGTNKNTTTIGDRAFIGSNVTLVAPLTVGDDAYIAAGTVVTHDVADSEMAIARSRQENCPPKVAARLRRRFTRRRR